MPETVCTTSRGEIQRCILDTFSIYCSNWCYERVYSQFPQQLQLLQSAFLVTIRETDLYMNPSHLATQYQNFWKKAHINNRMGVGWKDRFHLNKIVRSKLLFSQYCFFFFQRFGIVIIVPRLIYGNVALPFYRLSASLKHAPHTNMFAQLLKFQIT